LLVAVIWNVLAADGTKVAMRPLGVSPPAGETLQVTPPVQAPCELTVAVSVTLEPTFTVVAPAVSETEVTVQGLSPPPPQAPTSAASVHPPRPPILRMTHLLSSGRVNGERNRPPRFASGGAVVVGDPVAPRADVEHGRRREGEEGEEEHQERGDADPRLL